MVKEEKIKSISLAQAIVEQMDRRGESFVETMRGFLFACEVARIDLDPMLMAEVVNDIADIWVRRQEKE